mmetsp:Transcript_24636/g.64823  ORF Transcript_24636/g.64823 Transcript_24636/m.64823 type:complete len:235 (-) Transcript_24636:294-998(-)
MLPCARRAFREVAVVGPSRAPPTYLSKPSTAPRDQRRRHHHRRRLRRASQDHFPWHGIPLPRPAPLTFPPRPRALPTVCFTVCFTVCPTAGSTPPPHSSPETVSSTLARRPLASGLKTSGVFAVEWYDGARAAPRSGRRGVFFQGRARHGLFSPQGRNNTLARCDLASAAVIPILTQGFSTRRAPEAGGMRGLQQRRVAAEAAALALVHRGVVFTAFGDVRSVSVELARCGGRC